MFPSVLAECYGMLETSHRPLACCYWSTVTELVYRFAAEAWRGLADMEQPSWSVICLDQVAVSEPRGSSSDDRKTTL